MVKNIQIYFKSAFIKLTTPYITGVDSLTDKRVRHTDGKTRCVQYDCPVCKTVHPVSHLGLAHKKVVDGW